MKADQLTIVSAATPGYLGWQYAKANHERFAGITGHAYVHKNSGFNPDLPPSWSKIKFLTEEMSNTTCEWLMWIDADAVFVRPTSLIEFCETDRELVVSTDANGINLGAFFIRNSSYSIDLLSRLWRLSNRFGSHIWWEQSAMTHLYRNDSEIRANVEISLHRRFNRNPNEDIISINDVVYHFAGALPESRAEYVRHFGGQFL